MGLGTLISRSLSVAGSSNYESSHRSGSASTISTVCPPSSRTPQASTSRASTVTSATSMSKLMRSASTSRESMSPSMSSTIRPPSSASRTSQASTMRASTITSATSTSKLIRSASTASTVSPQISTPASSTTSLVRSNSKRNPLHFSTAASRFLWGRSPPGHSTLQPSQIASLTHTLSLPIDTPMLSSVVGALGVPLSRSQFSPAPKCFCDAHFWFDQKYIDELTEVIAHEIGPQLDKLRIAPKELISKKTKRLLSLLQPYQDIFTSIPDSSSIVSMKPACPACTLGQFFQNPDAVNALTICVKGRKHRSHPWPASMAWLDPCPGKGVDWESKWRSEGKSAGHDRVRVQRWRRENRVQGQVPEEPRVPGHQAGEGCDFCDALRMERADDAELDAAIAEEDEERAAEIMCDAAQDETGFESSDSETLRAMEEESIIRSYLPSTTTLSSVDRPGALHRSEKEDEAKEGRERSLMGFLANRAGEGDVVRKERAKRASEWARSYQLLVGRGPDVQTSLQFPRYPEMDVRGAEVRVGGGWI